MYLRPQWQMVRAAENLSEWLDCEPVFAVIDSPESAASGSSSAVERRLPKPDVAGSIPVSRSTVQQ